MRNFARVANALGTNEWEQLEKLAGELRGRSLLPVSGAGASLGCAVEPKVPPAKKLAEELHGAIKAGRLPLVPEPCDLDQRQGELGMMAEAACLQHQPTDVLLALGFGERVRWPGVEQVERHDCPYEVFARMARERLIEETLTFNYDCHNEAACQAQGFLPQEDELESRFWPLGYGVVADEAGNANLGRRDFTVIKAHGCVERWREVSAAVGPRSASEAIVIRHSQLLDWRSDFWARDLMADRVRRHVLLLVGCSLQDPVIQISLKRLMEGVRKVDPKGQARVHVLDIKPNTLALKTILKVSSDERPTTREITEVTIPGKNENQEMGGMLLALLTLMLATTLKRTAGSLAAHLPDDAKARTTLLGVSAPMMTRWSWWFHSIHRFGEMGLAVDLKRRGDDCYVPLLADPILTLRAVSVRKALLERLGRGLEMAPEQVPQTGFVIDHSKGTAVMPLGLSENEFESAVSIARSAEADLSTPELERYVAVVSKDGQDLTFYSLSNGQKAARDPF